MEASTAPG
jgi:hypothetical protein